MRGAAAFLGLGANEAEPGRRLAEGLAALAARGVRIAAVARAVWSPYQGPDGRPAPEVAPVLNTVAEVRTDLSPDALLRLGHEVEALAGRRRDGRATRSLDVDLLAWQDATRSDPGITIPHARIRDRAFVLSPWEEVAPLFVVPGTGLTVVEHAARLRARDPGAFRALRRDEIPALPPGRGSCIVLPDFEALRVWRATITGVVGVVPTLGALHEGHAAHVRRARAECDAVLATIFVNPLQFGPSEDFTRYPRTFEADVALLRAAGADAVYAPTEGDLYPPGFSTSVDPAGPSAGFEGAVRPGHFRGVATVVTKLLVRTGADRAYFGWKDAQQVAVVRRAAKDLDLSTEIVAGPTVRDRDGLALSSRNRYLSPEDRARALALPRALEALSEAAAGGERRGAALAAQGRRRLEEAGLPVDYVEVVDPDTMAAVESLSGPALAVAAVRAGGTRLLDNRWLAPG